MKILWKYFAYFFVTILLNFGYFKNGYCGKHSSTFDLITLALYRDIKFMYERPEQVNDDAIFGIIFVQVHVSAVLEHKNAIVLTEKNRRMLEEILMLCEIAINDGKKVVKDGGLEMMIRPEVWNRTIFWKNGELGKKRSTSRGLTRADFLMDQGTPSELESLRCFLSLLVRDENLVCAVSNECAELLVRKDSPRGYPLTHRLLYVQLAIGLGCEENSQVRFAGMKKDFCTAILQELIDIESLNFPSFTRDLAMEQVALCGTEGYLEFANEHYAKLIAGWPNSHGCYSAFGFHRGEKRNREKRSTSVMDYGCDNHACAVAAASLSLLIRSAVENSIPEFF